MAGRRELKGPADAERSRNEIIRRATLYSIGFLLAGVATAVLGAALIALLMSLIGMPFLRTWLMLTGVVLAAAVAALLVQGWRGRSRPRGGGNPQAR
jgi:membrane protein implicated in regulation of membrane protease activity